MVRATRMRCATGEDQEVLVRQERLLVDELQPGGGRLGHDDAGSDALFGVGSRAAFAVAVVDDADAALGLQRARDVLEKRHLIFDLVKRVDDQHRIQCAPAEAAGRRLCRASALTFVSPSRCTRRSIASIISRCTSTA